LNLPELGVSQKKFLCKDEELQEPKRRLKEKAKEGNMNPSTAQRKETNNEEEEETEREYYSLCNRMLLAFTK